VPTPPITLWFGNRLSGAAVVGIQQTIASRHSRPWDPHRENPP
jgi:hypothetical protein